MVGRVLPTCRVAHGGFIDSLGGGEVDMHMQETVQVGRVQYSVPT